MPSSKNNAKNVYVVILPGFIHLCPFINIGFVICIRVQRHPFERIATPFQVYSWTAPQIDHAMDCVRAEDAYTSRLGYEEHIPGQVCSKIIVFCACVRDDLH